MTRERSELRDRGQSLSCRLNTGSKGEVTRGEEVVEVRRREEREEREVMQVSPQRLLLRSEGSSVSRHPRLPQRCFALFTYLLYPRVVKESKA